MRITASQKDIVGYQVAKEWVDSARQFLKDGCKPAKFTSIVERNVWVKPTNRFGEDAEDISRRTLTAIVKIAKHHARMLIAYNG